MQTLVDQMVKNPPTIQETWVQSLGQEDPLERGMATHSSVLAWRTHTDMSHLRIDEHLGCFPLLAITSDAAMNTVHIFTWTRLYTCLYPGVELLDHVVIQSLSWVQLFSTPWTAAL